MWRAIAVVVVAATVAAVAGCGSSSNSCKTNQIQVTYFGSDRDGETDCEPVPASCGANPSCSVQACESDMYGLCQSPYLGVGCSDTFPPVIISCNL